MKNELKHAFISWNFLITVLLSAATFFMGIAEDLASLKTMDIIYFFNLCMQLSPLMVFLPFLSALPYGYNFIDEYNSNFFRFSLSRAGSRKYVFNKVFSVTLSCFCAVFLGIILWVVVIGFFAQKTDFSQISHLQNFEVLKSSRLYGNLLDINVYLYILCYSFFISLFATLWPVIGMISSTYIKNRYVSLIMPFIAFFLIWQLGGRLAHFIPSGAGFLMLINVYYGDFGLFGNAVISFICTVAFVLLWQCALSFWFYKRIKKCQ